METAARAEVTARGDGGGEASEATAPAPARSGGSIPYFPAFDGLRGMGAFMVLLYHAGYNHTIYGSWMAVSMFFTLSGFLITSLILREREATGTVDLKRFFIHRFRRLMPAASMCLLLVLAFAFFAADDTQRAGLRSDLLSAQFYGANWRFVASNQAYAELFNSGSPVIHFWSLAIEEQFYLVYPLVVVLLFTVGKISLRTFGIIIGALFAVSASLPYLVPMTTDRFYYGTDTRGAEVLAGVLLAVFLAKRDLDHPGWSPSTVRAIRVGGGLAMSVTLGLWFLLPREADVVYLGGMPVYAGITVVLLLGCMQRSSMAAQFFTFRPWVEMGKLSYGIYVYHWPLYLWLDEERTGIPQFPLMVVRIAVTLVLAYLSARYIEMPIRRGQRLFRVPTWTVILPASAAITALILVVTALRPAESVAAERATGPIDERAVTQLDAFVPPPTTLPAFSDPVAGAVALEPRPSHTPDRPLRTLIVGDSTAVSLAAALDRWGKDTGTLEIVNSATRGCGIVRGGQKLQLYKDEPWLVENPDNCDWSPKIVQNLSEFQPDMIVLAESLWDTTDHILPGDTVLRGPGDPTYDAVLQSEYQALFDTLAQGGVPIVWLRQPPALWGVGLEYEGRPFAASDPARMDRLNEIVGTIAASTPLTITAPYDEFYAAWPGGVHDPALRVDGIHPTGSGGDIVAAWLGPELLASYWDAWSVTPPAG